MEVRLTLLLVTIPIYYSRLCLYSNIHSDPLDQFSLCQFHVLLYFHEMRTNHLSISLTATFGVLLIYWFFGHASYPTDNKMTGSSQAFKYEAVTGYFLQDDPKTDPDTFEYVCHFCFTCNQDAQI